MVMQWLTVGFMISQASVDTSPQDRPAISVSSVMSTSVGVPATRLSRMQADMCDSTEIILPRPAPAACQSGAISPAASPPTPTGRKAWLGALPPSWSSASRAISVYPAITVSGTSV